MRLMCLEVTKSEMLKGPVPSHVHSPVHNLMVMKKLESKHNAGRVEPTDGTAHMPSLWEHGTHILNPEVVYIIHLEGFGFRPTSKPTLKVVP